MAITRSFQTNKQNLKKVEFKDIYDLILTFIVGCHVVSFFELLMEFFILLASYSQHTEQSSISSMANRYHSWIQRSAELNQGYLLLLSKQKFGERSEFSMYKLMTL